ncbi:TetR/AcrR family transcriptional regulator [Streptomyces sp. NBC_01334]|uniref:TetR/AcrR family transcriptional regulator n=1 Tax=Streptomyces sp. NBC_01334 TaxID=2903827 RepID=UPI002E0D82F1|nr:TetR family transcriptional regulator [Streptomyces sp. NBC_01334]
MSVEARREQFVKAAIEVMSREGLDRATTRRIAEYAGAPQGAVHYAFRDKNELLTAVVGEITNQIEQVLRDAVDPAKGLDAAIHDGLHAFWAYAVGDDGLQLMQYELTIYCRRTPGLERLAEWQYTRYSRTAQEAFQSALDQEPKRRPLGIDLTELARLTVAMMDGLVIQYEVHHDRERSRIDLGHAIRAAVTLAKAPAGDD